MSNVNISLIPGFCGFKLDDKRVYFKDMPGGLTAAHGFLTGFSYMQLKRVNFRAWGKELFGHIQVAAPHLIWNATDEGKPEFTSLFDRESDGEHIRGHEHFYLGFVMLERCNAEQKLVILASIVSMSLSSMASISTECRGRNVPVGSKSGRKDAILESTEGGNGNSSMGEGSGTKPKRVRTSRVGKDSKAKLLQSEATVGGTTGVPTVHVDIETGDHMDGGEGKGENSNSKDGTASIEEIENGSVTNPFFCHARGGSVVKPSYVVIQEAWVGVKTGYPDLAVRVYNDKEALKDMDPFVLHLVENLAMLKNVELANQWSDYDLDKEKVIQLCHLSRLALKQGKWRGEKTKRKSKEKPEIIEIQ